MGRHLVSRFIYFRDDSRRARNLFLGLCLSVSQRLLISGMFSMLPSTKMSRRCSSDLRRQSVGHGGRIADSRQSTMLRHGTRGGRVPESAQNFWRRKPITISAHRTSNNLVNLIYSGQLYRTKNIYFRRDLSSSQTLHMTLIPFLSF